MADESAGSDRQDHRLVELFREASQLEGPAREAFLGKVREEDADLASNLEELLGQSSGPLPTEPGSFARRLQERCGSEADPHITLEGAGDTRVVRAVEGDGDALEVLLRELGPAVAAGLSIDPRWQASFDREDVMQVTYLEAYLRIATLRARTIEGFRGWLARMAGNNLRDALRALQRDKRPHGEGRRRAAPKSGDSTETLMGRLLDTDSTAGSAAGRREAARRLRGAIERLPESYRRVVEEVDLAERPVNEVAAELRKSPGAVHMVRSRAHDRLRELLGGATGFF